MRNNKPIEVTEDSGFNITIERDVHMYLVRFEVSEAECNKHDGLYQIKTRNQGGEATCSIQVNIKGKFIYLKTNNNNDKHPKFFKI